MMVPEVFMRTEQTLDHAQLTQHSYKVCFTFVLISHYIHRRVKHTQLHIYDRFIVCFSIKTLKVQRFNLRYVCPYTNSSDHNLSDPSSNIQGILTCLLQHKAHWSEHDHRVSVFLQIFWEHFCWPLYNFPGFTSLLLLDLVQSVIYGSRKWNDRVSVPESVRSSW